MGEIFSILWVFTDACAKWDGNCWDIYVWITVMVS